MSGIDKSNLGFNQPKVEAEKESVQVPKKTVPPVTPSNEVVEDNDLDREYYDERTITISLVKNYSLYRKANDKVLPKRVDYIGSSVTSSRTLASNKQEIETYFPNIVGLSPNDPSFITRVKQYLNNIRIPVDELGRTFDVGFHYYKKRDYLRVKAEEERIETAFNESNRSDSNKIREALQLKINKINALESTKCVLGYPNNISDYLMYRHCLLYKDVAKDMSLINSDPNIRFYFKDNVKEAEKLQKYREQVIRAKQNYVACTGDNVLFDAVYVQYCLLNNLPILSSLAEDRLSREIKLDEFSTKEPLKFNKICGNKDVKLIAQIEMLIARGELVRSTYNQNISTVDGEFIGANITEAISWFKNPENTSIVNAYLAKLKV